MRYKVYDTINKKYITDDQDLILKPDGRIARNDYGDEVGIEGCVVLFYLTDSDIVYVDEEGGVHEDGHGWDPIGNSCGECSNISCKICSLWKHMNSVGELDISGGLYEE